MGGTTTFSTFFEAVLPSLRIDLIQLRITLAVFEGGKEKINSCIRCATRDTGDDNNSRKKGWTKAPRPWNSQVWERAKRALLQRV